MSIKRFDATFVLQDHDVSVPVLHADKFHHRITRRHNRRTGGCGVVHAHMAHHAAHNRVFTIRRKLGSDARELDWRSNKSLFAAAAIGTQIIRAARVVDKAINLIPLALVNKGCRDYFAVA